MATIVFFYPEQWIFFFCFSIRAASHKLLVPGHRLFPQCHGLECQVARDKDFGDGCVACCGWVLNLAAGTKLGNERATLIRK
jgi:hypothetical protein